jgi:hypothetical protein
MGTIKYFLVINIAFENLLTTQKIVSGFMFFFLSDPKTQTNPETLARRNNINHIKVLLILDGAAFYVVRLCI